MDVRKVVTSLTFRLQSKAGHMTFLELAIENEGFTATDITLG